LNLRPPAPFEEIGGVDNLVEWARCNQTEFYRMLARLMPREIHADVNAGYSLVELLQEIDEREVIILPKVSVKK